jgi:hypothetical protein
MTAIVGHPLPTLAPLVAIVLSCVTTLGVIDHAKATTTTVQAGTVEAADIGIGDTLQAVRDVELDQATVAKGSKVAVSGRKVAQGRIFLDVALADGHVVHAVPLVSIRQNFQRVQD